MREFTSLDELSEAIGEPIGPGPWLTVEQPRIDAFADSTGDDQWIHVDPVRASDGPYGTTIAHGYLTLSLLPMLGRDLFTLAVGTARLNYGSNKVRFPAAVRSGTRIRATATPANLRRENSSALLAVDWVVENDGQAKPALVAETLTMVLL
ncbi:MaoC family dehydratase [Nocardia cyriacigeorgica]|uniref:MaoC family dehydratase n=1 Tax=Nocardia cyriacigeorgica TaxID=135487 RepID=A0A5R8P7Z5_9NOCA|nr:MaoC family dehydratase [Nocardia cyriacigeorgica]